MPFTGKVGDTLHIPDVWGGHRYIVLTEPNNDGKVVIVNFTSFRPGKECPVLFRPKDNKHIFRQLTTISCADADIVTVESLVREAKNNFPGYYAPCSLLVTHKVVVGTLKSQLTKIEVLDELGTQYPDEYNKYVTPENISENNL